jgi:integrase/recombinase XerD
VSPAIEAYLALRRSAGFALLNDEYLLRNFARFAAEHGERQISAATAIAWASQTRSLMQRDARLKSVCRFASFVRLEDPTHELPPARHFAHPKVRRSPYIYTDDELERLLQAALALGPSQALRPYTYACLIALLSATGLRVGEALRLRLADLSTQGLVIHQTKFRKSRLVPLHVTTSAGLERYLRRRRCWIGEDDPLFVTDSGHPLPYPTVHQTFIKLLTTARIEPLPGGRRPRLHDLRHRFAVRALQTCAPGRGAASQHMLALATYLGHTNINNTYWYLEATAQLREGIAAASEAFYEEATL